MKTLKDFESEATKMRPTGGTKDKLVCISIESKVKEILDQEAANRGRSTSSLLYMLLHHTTDGFIDFSAADLPLVKSDTAEEVIRH